MVLGLGVIASSCTGASEPEPTLTPAVEPTLSTHVETAPPVVVEGRLPDGTGFHLTLDPAPAVRDPVGISAAIAIDLAQVDFTHSDLGCSEPCPVVLGIATFERSEGRRYTSYRSGVFKVSSGDWTMTIQVYDHVIDAWDVDIGQVLVDNIRPLEANSGLPAFDLSGPFAWASDTEIPLQMGVDFGSFVVRRGCSEGNVGCSPTGDIQVIPAELVSAPAPAWDYAVSVTVADAD